MNTLAIHAGHFAPNNTPFRERRELFFAKERITEEGGGEYQQGPDAKINSIVTKTREDLSQVMGMMFPASTETNILRSNEITDTLKIREKIEGAKEQIEQNLRQALANPEIAQEKLEEAQKFLQKLQKVVGLINGIDANTEVIPEHAVLSRKTLAMYDRESGKIFINKKLSTDSKAEKEALEHERAHAILDILTERSGLFPGLISDSLDAVRGLKDEHGETFVKLLFSLKETGSYRHIQSQDLSITECEEAFMEELLVRYADYQARRSRTFHKTELKLFDMLEQSGQGTMDVDRDPALLPRTHKSPKTPRKGTMALEEEENPEKKQGSKTAQQVIEQIEKLQPKIDRLRSLYLSIQSLSPDLGNEAGECVKKLDEDVIPILKTKALLEELHLWNAGQAPPAVCRSLLEQLGHGNRQHLVDEVLQEKGMTENDWSTKPGEIRTMYAQEISKRVGFDKALTTLFLQFQQYEVKILDEVRKETEETLNKLNEENRLKGGEKGKMTGSLFGIQFYSINEIVEVFKKVSKAYSDAWTERRTRREAELTSTVAEAVPAWPFGDTVRNTLLRETDSTLTSADEEELKTLQSNRTHFSDLFNPGGRLEQMMKSPATTKKAIAILEYAAERGWLYDIRKNDKQGEGIPKILFGRFNIYQLLPSYWSDSRKNEWYLTLSSKNTGGIEHEIDHEYKAVHSVDKAPEFVKKFAHELHHLNYWGAIGIAKRALERGLDSAIGPWLSAEFMAHMEQHREYAQNREIFDKLGLLTFANSMSTMSYFKWERDGWLNFSENNQMKIENSGVLGRTYKMLKDEILKADPSLGADPHDTSKLSHHIASVMAGKIVVINDKKFSIFNDKYRPFNVGSGLQSKIDNIGDEDPDYYTDISDNIHGDETVYKQILQITGSGFFTMKERAGYFVERLIEVYKGHKEAGLENEAQAFKDTISRKLTSWLIPTFTDGRSQSTPAETFGVKSDYAGKSVVVEMAKSGIVSFEPFKRAYDAAFGTEDEKASANMAGVNAGFVSNFFARLFEESNTVDIPNYGTVTKAQFSKVFSGGGGKK